MTPTQQTDLTNWLKDQSQQLPNSLDNLLIEDCLEELNNNEKASNRFESLHPLKLRAIIPALNPLLFKAWDSPIAKQYFIQTFLSRTPDGAVMPFLNVKVKNSNLTLDNILYNSFVEALRIGKTLDEALKIINKIYILQRYAPN